MHLLNYQGSQDYSSAYSSAFSSFNIIDIEIDAPLRFYRCCTFVIIPRKKYLELSRFELLLFTCKANVLPTKLQPPTRKARNKNKLRMTLL